MVVPFSIRISVGCQGGEEGGREEKRKGREERRKGRGGGGEKGMEKRQKGI